MLLGDAPARDIYASEGRVDQWPIRHADLSERPDHQLPVIALAPFVVPCSNQPMGRGVALLMVC
jgi:hypothetical protein